MPEPESRELRTSLWPGAATRFAGVIGDPVAHSLSPRLHNAAYAALGLDWAFGAYLVAPDDVAAAIEGLRAIGFGGLAVTMPHKDAAARLCDQASERVKRLGAANTIVFRSGIAIAESTDGEGLLADLSVACGFDPSGKTCAVVGAGGAARAVVLALAEAGASRILVLNRTAERAKAAAALAGKVGRVAVVEELGGAALVVNATPLGMLGSAGKGQPEADVGEALGERLGSGQLAVELVYSPSRTPFLEAARRNGATGRNGLGMLVHQAARQVALFTGEEAPLEAMWAAVADHAT